MRYGECHGGGEFVLMSVLLYHVEVCSRIQSVIVPSERSLRCTSKRLLAVGEELGFSSVLVSVLLGIMAPCPFRTLVGFLRIFIVGKLGITIVAAPLLCFIRLQR